MTTLAAPPTTSPTTAPTSQTSDIDVREWVIFISEAGQPTASGRTLFKATLPPYMTSRRENAPAGEDNRPTPMGVIRLVGDVDRETPVDVLLTLPNSSDVQATWPKAQVRPNRILWNNVYTDETAKTGDLPDKHWMAPLRKTGSALIRSGNQAERFLLYDVAFPYKAPLQLKADPDGTLRATNTGTTPLLDLTFYKKKDNAWTRATIARLAGRPEAAPPAGDKKPGPATRPDPNAAFDAAPATQPTTGPVGNRVFFQATISKLPLMEREKIVVEERPAAAVATPTTEPAAQPRIAAKRAMGPTTRRAGEIADPLPTTTATTLPAAATTVPTTSRATDTGTSVAFAPVGDDQAVLLLPWKAALADAGVLPGDVDTVVSVLKTHGLNDRWMTAIYRLDPAEMDRLLPIEIVPSPRKISRVGLVIVRGMDPSINEEIDRLIKQCGDPDYAQRRAATAELISLGQPAKAKVEKAVNDKDPEISLRAEQILAAIEKKKG